MIGNGVNRTGAVIVAGLVVALPFTPAETAKSGSDGAFVVSVSIHATCSVIATDMVFGTTAGSRADGTSTVTVTCDVGTPYNIRLGVRPFSQAAAEARETTGAAGGLTLSIPDTLPITASGAPQTITVRGRMPAAPSGSPDDDTEIIIVTVSY